MEGPDDGHLMVFDATILMNLSNYGMVEEFQKNQDVPQSKGQVAPDIIKAPS